MLVILLDKEDYIKYIFVIYLMVIHYIFKSDEDLLALLKKNK
jgi:hypothetical protein